MCHAHRIIETSKDKLASMYQYGNNLQPACAVLEMQCFGATYQAYSRHKYLTKTISTQPRFPSNLLELVSIMSVSLL